MTKDEGEKTKAKPSSFVIHPSSAPQVHTIDLELMGAEGVVAAYFVPSSTGHIVVDCGPSSTLPKLRQGVEKLGYNFADVRHLLLTHIHLDHAGAAGTLARELGLQVYVHKNGAIHLERPERLLESAKRIYGEMMDTLWGQFEAVPKSQMVVLEGEEILQFGELEIKALYTPGHAIHHLSFVLGDDIFTGDVGGVRLQGSSYVIAPTPPPDIQLADWRESLEKIKQHNPKRLFPTHFGMHEDVAEHLSNLENSLETLETLTNDTFTSGGDTDILAAAIKRMAAEQIRDRSLEQKYEISTPYQMVASGLARYWKNRK
jgi:glyoxylase-like metal-dependent hydrolase (beta-lactamase superfamily II)